VAAGLWLPSGVLLKLVIFPVLAGLLENLLLHCFATICPPPRRVKDYGTLWDSHSWLSHTTSAGRKRTANSGRPTRTSGAAALEFAITRQDSLRVGTVVGCALTGCEVSDVFLLFGLISLAGAAISFATVETLERALEEISP
jgi:hypothetical protein